MHVLAVYIVLIAIVISTIGLNLLVAKGYKPSKANTLSELVAQRATLLWEFRIVLWICVILFSLALFLYIIPYAPRSHIWLYVVSIYVCITEVLASLFPAKGRWLFLHNVSAKSMAAAMVVLTVLFANALNGGPRQIEGILAASLAILLVAANLDYKHFIYYEMPFLFISHLSILIAALAIRG